MSQPTPFSDNLWQPFWAKALAVFDEVKMAIQPDETTLKHQLETLYTQLVATNQHTNLTRIADAEGFLHRHVLDSWTLLPYIPPHSTVLDIGTGAGFPALPLALVRPDCTIHAVDSVAKKVAFIQSVVGQLKLPNCHSHHARIEDLGRDEDFREKIDMVTARGVAALPTLLELSTPCLKVGGQLLAMKSQSGWETELTQAGNALNTLNASATDVYAVGDDTVIGGITKDGPTPAKYPRGKNHPRTKPL